ALRHAPPRLRPPVRLRRGRLALPGDGRRGGRGAGGRQAARRAVPRGRRRHRL
ncbi:MAG: hypothetical protein AVDCRST_MAG04-761, partial [uncultured Acetobacteraceae bacterium]